jgi:NitT/TauT family transport system permease protein
MSASSRLREMLRQDMIVAPGAYDCITARAVLIRTAKVLRLSPVRTMLWVLLPACLPDVVNGLRISFSLTMLGVLVGEMFSSQRGLGFLPVNGMAQHNVPLSTAVVLIIVVVAIAASTLMLRLGRQTAHR